jgi:hypothetical protein
MLHVRHRCRVLVTLTDDGQSLNFNKKYPGSLPQTVSQKLFQIDTKINNLTSLILQNTDMEPQSNCGPGLWYQVAHLNMSDPSQQCPSVWREYNTRGIRASGNGGIGKREWKAESGKRKRKAELGNGRQQFLLTFPHAQSATGSFLGGYQLDKILGPEDKLQQYQVLI